MRNSWPFPTPIQTGVPPVLMYAGLAVGAFLLYKLWSRGVAGTAADVTRGVISTVADTGAGIVTGAAEVVGIPQTSQDQCVEDLYAGRTWDASFSCPASTFIRATVGGTLPPRNKPSGLSGLNRNC